MTLIVRAICRYITISIQCRDVISSVWTACLRYIHDMCHLRDSSDLSHLYIVCFDDGDELYRSLCQRVRENGANSLTPMMQKYIPFAYAAVSGLIGTQSVVFAKSWYFSIICSDYVQFYYVENHCIW